MKKRFIRLMRRSPCLKQHLREKSFARNEEKILFFVAEHFTFFLFAHTLLSVEASDQYKQKWQHGSLFAPFRIDRQYEFCLGRCSIPRNPVADIIFLIVDLGVGKLGGAGRSSIIADSELGLW